MSTGLIPYRRGRFSDPCLAPLAHEVPNYVKSVLCVFGVCALTNSLKLRGIRASDGARLSSGDKEGRVAPHCTDASPAIPIRCSLLAIAERRNACADV